MFCLKCGKQIEDKAKFCLHCGASVGGSGVTAPTVQEPEPKKGTGGAQKRIIAGAVAAVVAVGAVAAGLSMFGGASGKVLKAFNKSYSAYADAVEAMNLTDINGILKGQKYSQQLRLEIGSSSDVPLEDLGLQISWDTNIPGKEMGASVTPFYGSADLLTAGVQLDNSNVYVYAPELFDDEVYGLNTELLGETLDDWGAPSHLDVDSLSFNIFNMMNTITQAQEEMEKNAQEQAKAAGKELLKAIEVEKTDSKTLTVNGTSTKCNGYQVIIPEKALSKYLSTLEKAADAKKLMDTIEDVFEQAGIPDEIMDEIDFKSMSGGSEELFDELDGLLDELGDIELEVYISGGYISVINYEFEVYGEDAELTVELGGGKNYVDNLTLTVESGGETLEVVSQGDHAGKSGVFTDETVVELDGYEALSSEFSYEPKKQSDNFSLVISADEGSTEFELEGQLSCTKDSMEVRIENLEISDYGSYVEIALEYKLSPYKKSISVSSPIMLENLSEDDLMDIASDISESFDELYYDLLEDIPELRYMF